MQRLLCGAAPPLLLEQRELGQVELVGNVSERGEGGKQQLIPRPF